MSEGFISYKNSSTVMSESVYQFLHGMMYGTAWSLVDPFPVAGSAAAAKEAATGVFRPVPPFGNMASIPQNAIYFGSILAWQRLCCKSLELIRRREDFVNEIFGLGMVYPYYRYILNHSAQRLVRHNRVVGGGVVLSVVYANFFA